MRVTLLILTVYMTVVSCAKKETEVTWTKSFYQIGSQSSPRVIDINHDDIKDVIIGAGKSELGFCEQGILAIDGATGETIWTQTTDAQVVGSAQFIDINQDETPDIVIGGRAGTLKALDGMNGNVIWEYEYQYEDHPILQFARYNFYNSSIVPDQDNDGIKDILAINGGNWDAAPNDMSDRWPGVLMLISSARGTVLAADTMPDGAESYMSPLYFSQHDDPTGYILIGSGGETQSGSLYITTIDDLKDQQLSKAVPLLHEEKHGFIAPPTLVDLDGDDNLDILSISHAGTITAISGDNHAILWSQRFEGSESSTQLTVGRFTGDNTPDVFAIINTGSWPAYTGSREVVLDGETGEVVFTDSIGCIIFSSGVAADLNSDGWDEVVMSITDYACSTDFKEVSSDSMSNKLMTFNFRNGETLVIQETPRFKNIFSTPWVGDMDDDNYLDIIHCQYFHFNNIYEFIGSSMSRISTGIRVKDPLRWGAYMGSQYDGIYHD